MKTFEEKFTAWVDGQLAGVELIEFEAELAAVEDAELNKAVAHQLGDLLRDYSQVPALQNADFFNRQILDKIRSEMPVTKEIPEHAGFFWSISRLALAGAFCLLIALGLFHFMIPSTQESNTARDLAQDNTIKTQSGDPAISVSAFHSQQNDVTVLWLEGLKYIPDKKHPALKGKSPKNY